MKTVLKRGQKRTATLAAAAGTKLVQPGVVQLRTGLSILENKTVGSRTQKKYHECYDEFMAFCREEGTPTTTVAELDLAATHYLDFRYL